VRQDDGKQSYTSDKTETEAIHNILGRLLPQKAEDMAAVAADLGYKSLPLAGENAYTLFKGVNGADTPGGYKGRMGLYEVFGVTEAIQELILKHSTSGDIQRAAQAEGMITMQEDGYLKALAGLTSLTEVNRVASADSA
jgi:type IV pilus assembly protein PilB